MEIKINTIWVVISVALSLIICYFTAPVTYDFLTRPHYEYFMFDLDRGIDGLITGIEINLYGTPPEIINYLPSNEQASVMFGYREGWSDARSGLPDKYNGTLWIPEDYSYGYIRGHADGTAHYQA